MTRQLIDSPMPPPLPAQTVGPAAPSSPESGEVASAQVVSEALAGALPGWDLLPGNGFVRRRR